MDECVNVESQRPFTLNAGWLTFLLVGGNPLPVLLAARALDAANCVLVHTPQSAAQADRLLAVLAGSSRRVDRLALDDGADSEEVQAKIFQRAYGRSAPVHLDYSGGLATMAVHGRLALERLRLIGRRVSASYLDGFTDDAVLYLEGLQPQRLADLMAGRTALTAPDVFTLNNRLAGFKLERRLGFMSGAPQPGQGPPWEWDLDTFTGWVGGLLWRLGVAELHVVGQDHPAPSGTLFAVRTDGRTIVVRCDPRGVRADDSASDAQRSALHARQRQALFELNERANSFGGERAARAYVCLADHSVSRHNRLWGVLPLRSTVGGSESALRVLGLPHVNAWLGGDSTYIDDDGASLTSWLGASAR